MGLAARRFAVAGVAIASVVLAACGQDEKPANPAPTATQPIFAIPTLPPASSPIPTREPDSTAISEPDTGTQQGPVAPDFTLPNANGTGEITLSELADQQPVVLVFYRAFW